MFNKITIIGCGLIGSSLLRAIEKKKLSKQLNIFDKSKEVSLFIKNNFKAVVFNDISDSVIDSDLVIISSPLSSYKEILLSIKSNLTDLKWDDTINLFKDMNSLHIIYYEESKSKKGNTKKIYIRNSAKLKRRKSRKKLT